MQVTTTSSIADRNVVFDNILEDYVGGCQLDTDRIPDATEVLPAGTPIYVDTSTRIGYVVKTATLKSGGTSQILYVEPENLFEAAEYVSDGRITSLISTAAASGTTKDAISVGTALSTYAAGTVIAESISTSKFGVPVFGTLELGNDGGTVEITSSNPANAGLAFVINAHTGADTLSVSYTANIVTIAAATSTTTKNTDLLITQAIRDIDSTEWDFPSIQFRTPDSWDGNDDDATGATLTLAATTGYKYTPNAFLKDEVTVGNGVALYENQDVSVVMAGTVREHCLPYALPTAMKSAMTKFRFNY